MSAIVCGVIGCVFCYASLTFAHWADRTQSALTSIFALVAAVTYAVLAYVAFSTMAWWG